MKPSATEVKLKTKTLAEELSQCPAISQSKGKSDGTKMGDRVKPFKSTGPLTVRMKNIFVQLRNSIKIIKYDGSFMVVVDNFV